MDEDAGSLREHCRQQRSVQANRRKEILVECALPLAVVEGREAAAGSRGTTDHVDDDVDAAEFFHHRVGDGPAPFGGGGIGGPKWRPRFTPTWPPPSPAPHTLPLSATA